MSRFGLSPQASEFAQLVSDMDKRKQQILDRVLRRLHLENDRGQNKFTERFWQMPIRDGWLGDMEALLREIPETDG